MKSILYASIIGILVLSCKNSTTNGQNNTQQKTETETENTIMVDFSNRYPLASCTEADAKEVLKFFKTKSYSRPESNVFRNKILEKFKINIDTLDNNKKDDILYEDTSLVFPLYEKLAYSFPIAFRENRFMVPVVDDFIEDYFSDRTPFKDFPRERKEILYHFNNWIFYENKASFTFLKVKKPWTFMHLIHEYDYTGDDEYTSFILENLGEEREAQEDINEMVIGWVTGKKYYAVRKNVVEKIVELQPDLVFNIGMIVSDYSEYAVKTPENRKFLFCTYETEEQKLEDFSYLMNVLVDQGMVGILDELYNENPMVLGLLKKNDFYGYKGLKEYSLKAYGQTPYDEENPKPVYEMAVINDPDGYTNVRDKSGEIIFKIQDGEEFMVSKSKKEIIGEFYKEGWWYVSFKGQKGWIHKSRVKLNN
ncbi:SH3 domain-containing protein [Aquimarina muelleri]|uniref:SH3b domain-containing protein n=1 Tax=Aquimarina muelleri TaxID=279356 RepID=A0A918N650_9FLAO|nr:SH3 domain-containing protein [Aquimarina muelleri]MCX2762854.1 SH3 domain-containing protein [Aquimarina muelleri]GGX35555.1 hypothetical protein GCM10007384_39570 [Aquimarina muelleri]